MEPPESFENGPFAGCAITVKSHDRARHDALTAKGLTVPEIADGCEAALVCIGRHRAANHAEIAQALEALSPGGLLLIDGQKTDGMDSLVRLFRTHFDVAGVISKAHGKVLWLHRPESLPEIVASWRELGDLHPNQDGFYAAPGMFSHDAIDPGTAFLAEHFAPAIAGRVADLGAGWGALSSLLLAARPGITHIDLFEADKRAVDAAEANISDPRAKVHWADVTRLPAGQPYDAIVSNPPFHTTRKAEPSLGIAFIAAAARLLAAKGTFQMVANRHL
ncbi:MAG: methyltransferase, partial [Pseudomonadota bacterium]